MKNARLTTASLFLTSLTLHAAPGGDWQFVPAPDGNFLHDVTVLAPDDAWAVGTQDGPIPHPTVPQALRWDGSSWVEVPTPIPGVRRSRLTAIGAVSEDEIWAAGSQELQTGFGGSVRTNLLVMRWDGSEWEIMDTPKLGPNGAGALVRGIEVLGPNDIWFGGDWTGRALAMHWDGSDFTLHDTPVFGNGGSGTHGNGHAIESLSAVSSDDIWAVGGAADGDFADDESNIFHWNGSTWEHVPGPTPGLFHRLFGVTAIAADDVWAVGKSEDDGPFALHWDGSVWSLDSLPTFSHPTGQLDDITAFAADDIWAVGAFLLNPAPDVARPLLMHYDGTVWTQVASDPSGPDMGWFRGVDPLSDGSAWAVGGLGTGGPHTQRYEPDVCTSPIAYGTSKTTSIGTSPVLSWSGTPSAAAADFQLRVEQAVPGKAGLAFWGDTSASLPFMGGWLLVQPPLRRMEVRVLDATGSATYALEVEPGMIGATRYYQFWFRDIAHPDGTGSGLTSGLQVEFCD